MRQFAARSMILTAMALVGFSVSVAHGDSATLRSGDWSDPSVWSNGVPTARDVALVHGGHTLTVTSPDAVAKILQIADASGDGTLMIAQGGVLTVQEDGVVGNGPGRTGKLTVTGGELAFGGRSFRIGSPQGATGIVEMTSGRMSFTKSVYIGEEGTGILTIQGGEFTSGQDIVIGSQPTGVGTMTVTSGWGHNRMRQLIVGDSGKGTLHFLGSAGPTVDFRFRQGINFGKNSTLIIDVDETTGRVLKSGGSGKFILGGDLIIRKREGAKSLPPNADLFLNAASYASGNKDIVWDLKKLEISDDFVGLDRQYPWKARLITKTPNTISVSPQPLQQMTYGADFERLWHFHDLPGRELVDIDALVEWSVGKIPFDYVRIAIDPSAELEEGKFVAKKYALQLQVMNAIKKIRPDIKWFASPRPLEEAIKHGPFTSFPLWAGTWENPVKVNPKDPPRRFIRLDPEKAASYYKHALDFFKEQGFKISYMDVQNEATTHLKAEVVIPFVDALRKQMGPDMPIVIAPSAYSPPGAFEWLTAAKQMGRTDAWDITGVHNTDDDGNLQELVALSRSLGKNVIWNTEIHGLIGARDAASGPEKTQLAEMTSGVVFYHVRAGVSGLSEWMTLGNAKKEWKTFRNVKGKLVVMRPAHIWRELVLKTQGGRYLDSSYPGTVDSSMAFISKDGKTLTVWVLNTSAEPVKNVQFDFSKFDKAPRPLSVHYWNAQTPDEGADADLKSANQTFTHDIDGQTLYIFSFQL